MEEDGFDNLGFFILAVVYLFMGVGSLVSNAAINKIGTKGCLVLGGKLLTLTLTILHRNGCSHMDHQHSYGSI